MRLPNHNYNFTTCIDNFYYQCNHMIGVMISILASSAVDHGFKLRLGLTKEYKIGIYYFSALQHAALRRKSKDGLARN